MEILQGASLTIESSVAIPTPELNVQVVRLDLALQPQSTFPDAMVVVEQEQKISIVEVLLPVPDDSTYARRVEIVSENLSYRAEAAPGSDDASAVWRVRRITIDTDGTPHVMWADGSDAFDHAWSARAGYSYA